jgi:UDPglucose--hexose-1-phosphate uridylyltransferase
MSSERDSRLQSSLSEQHPLPLQANGGAAGFEFRSETIDNDTRLSSADSTVAFWPARPVRRSVLRSLNRSTKGRYDQSETTAYRGDGSTSHTRRDVLTGDWTIFAPRRDERPNEYAALEKSLQLEAPASHTVVDPACPFCFGSEGQTPEAVWSAKLGELSANPADVPSNRLAGPEIKVFSGECQDWEVRVVPNKFPAVSGRPSAGQKAKKDSRCLESDDLFPIADVYGGHEVIIESSRHTSALIESDSSLVYMTLMAFRDRILYWRDKPGINYIGVFKNCGPEAGASLRHSHSQLVATSILPHRVRSTLKRCNRHRARTGCSLGCDLLRGELDEQTRIIDKTDSFVAFCPFASRFAGMIRITSVSHQPYFDALANPSLDQLSSFLWRVLHWIDGVFPGKAYNFLLHTCPPGAIQPESFQWSLDIFPRLSKTAGFEWGSDCMINSLLPEAAAAAYRQVARQNDPRNVLAIR